MVAEYKVITCSVVTGGSERKADVTRKTTTVSQ